jgi:hypothetical protein
MDLKADLRDFWTYNTKQMFVYLEVEYWSGENQLNQISFYDAIIRNKKLVKLNRSIRQEYPIVSQNRQLLGTPLNVTLNWNIMPKVGVILIPSDNLLCCWDVLLATLQGIVMLLSALFLICHQKHTYNTFFCVSKAW